jgi:hypothetical protein
MLGVSGPLHRDLRGGLLDLGQIAGRQVDVDRSRVLVQALQPAGARDGNDPRLLCQQPLPMTKEKMIAA